MTCFQIHTTVNLSALVEKTGRKGGIVLKAWNLIGMRIDVIILTLINLGDALLAVKSGEWYGNWGEIFAEA